MVRKLGRTGETLFVVSFGGVLVNGMKASEANRCVAEAIDSGVNHFDVAPSYGDAESKLGTALKGKRGRIFLSCKTAKRDKEGAAQQLRQSLKNLRTDHFDVYQVHGPDDPAELDQVLAPGGAMEAFLEAKDAGLIRFIGITGHKPDTVLLDAVRRFDFDTVMFPVNFVHYYRLDLGKKLLAEVEERRIGVFAIKSMAARPWREGEEKIYPNCWYRPLDEPSDVRLALRFALSQPITTAVSSGDVRILRKMVAAAQDVSPITAKDEAKLRAMAEGLQPIFS